PRRGRAVRALISVYDKSGVAEFARGLVELGFELVSSGGTADVLAEAGLPVTRVEDVTGFPELLGGRVKTLHPHIHGGILARRGVPEDLVALRDHGIEPVDLVCVNLYPFELAVDRPELDETGLVEMIDIGGPTLLRAAAKNFASVLVVVRTQDYDEVLAELRAGGGASTPELRRRLAAIAFARSAAYDAAIARWFQRDSGLPEFLVPAFERVRELPYGENPHQQAAYYAERGARTHLLSFVDQLQGKDLSFNNLADLSAARLLVAELGRPACAIVKHANPCGVAVADTIEEAYTKALAADPVSAYGGVVVVNRAVSVALARSLAQQFVEVLFAPAYDVGTLEILAAKPSLRVLEHTEQRAPDESERDYRRVLGGLLVQSRDLGIGCREVMQVVAGTVVDAQWDDLLFALRVAKHVMSNAIVLARDGQTLGIGAGQMSRVDSVRIALDKARELGHSLDGAVLASDAFFPFPDGPQLALDEGVRTFIQPGGSKRDDEVIAAVAAAEGAMVFTGRRHFRH
ncbi:MAG TPA: bifunctional phosphoribosylaminoimidazolecarboxamide formyltransferase/IMP cyclohydrolase, partial [Gaiellaceae bacterium]|nr:bifunctional phosphoribosylaminoimidazolecarboxamide formyltransferase/IMP cyclohydrolase [Gaiellaceae bacterium]